MTTRHGVVVGRAARLDTDEIAATGRAVVRNSVLAGRLLGRFLRRGFVCHCTVTCVTDATPVGPARASAAIFRCDRAPRSAAAVRSVMYLCQHLYLNDEVVIYRKRNRNNLLVTEHNLPLMRPVRTVCIGGWPG